MEALETPLGADPIIRFLSDTFVKKQTNPSGSVVDKNIPQKDKCGKAFQLPEPVG